jgi:TRAP-type C4-dicarboxylate transport system permease large subunit
MLIGFSVAFGYMMAIMRIPAIMTELFLGISDNRYVFLLLVNVLLLVLGTFMDLAPMLLICTPIFLPVIKMFGIDPVHFGIVLVTNLTIAGITPPVGQMMFISCAVLRVPMEVYTVEILPFLGAMTAVLLLITFVPGISLWLPDLIMGR